MEGQERRSLSERAQNTGIGVRRVQKHGYAAVAG